MSDTSAPVLPLAPVDLDSLPHWQRKYCIAIKAGLTEKEAESSANIVKPTIAEWTTPGARKYDPVFARAVEMTRHGLAIMGRDRVRQETLAQAAVVMNDAFLESRGLDPDTGEKMQHTPILDTKGSVVGYREPIAARDRVANRRLVAEGGQLVGQAQAPVTDAAAVARALVAEMRAMREAELVQQQAQDHTPAPQLPAPALGPDTKADTRGG